MKWSKANSGPIVPDQDPLLKSFTQRIVRDEIKKDFDITQKVLGTGYSGAVRLAEHRETKKQVAVKQFSKRRLKPSRIRLLQSEVEVYLRLDHPNICRLLHAYEGKSDVWLIMELCACELYGRLCRRKVYTEADAADIMLQMLQAVNYLHNHNIVHRDLKLENWMYGAEENDDRLKLIDFGFSRILGCADETLDMPCGTLHYTSPEVLSRKYNSKADIWSLGVIGYMLVVGRPPFRGQNNVKIAKSILHADFPREGRWASLSSSVRDFLEQLLSKDPVRRPNAEQAISHPWVAHAGGVASSLTSYSSSIGPDVLKSLCQFAQGSHLRRAALTVLAYSLTSKELQDVEQTFLEFDRSGRGTISLKQLAEVLGERCRATSRPELSSQEVERIFECLDVNQEEEVHYTPFVAAMLAARINQHEDKIRAAFEAFDRNGTGYITADSLVQMFAGLSSLDAESDNITYTTSEALASSLPNRGLTMDEAEQWIREVDYKGNGVIDYDEFLDALTGKRLWTPLGDEETGANVKVYDTVDNGAAGRPRGMSESFIAEFTVAGRGQRHGFAAALIDQFSHDADAMFARRKRALSSPDRIDAVEYYPLQVRNVSCDVSDNYFK
jgi:calcium-dependent protein kinase